MEATTLEEMAAESPAVAHVVRAIDGWARSSAHAACRENPAACPDPLTCDAFDSLEAAVAYQAAEWAALDAEDRRIEDEARAALRLPAPKVDGVAEVLDWASTFIRRFVVFKDPRYADILALWVLHTWAFDASDSTPYIWVHSPEMGSGKTRLLEVLELVAREPWRVVEPSEAVTFRVIDKNCPTLLLDEIDVIFSKDRAGDTQAGLRGIMNSGYRRGAFVPRAENFGRDIKAFHTYCPKAFAGIGKLLPDTVVDRSVKIPMGRKRRDEAVERFSQRRLEPEVQPLRSRLRQAAEDADGFLREWREWVPEEFLLASDRHAEVWEPLFAIAEAAGMEWPVRAREMAAWTSEQRLAEPPVGILLLQHVREAFAEGEENISSRQLLMRLVQREDAPWGAWWEYQSHSDLIDLSRRLKEFDVEPKTVRVGIDTAKGYAWRDFEDVWERYLGPTVTDVTVVTV
jgi:hypothetical protein